MYHTLFRGAVTFALQQHSAWTPAHTSLSPINVRKTSLFLCQSICLEFSSRIFAGIWSVT